jgi:hypothetical protein
VDPMERVAPKTTVDEVSATGTLAEPVFSRKP